MTPPELNEDFADVLRALHEAGADFVIVGAHALAAFGVVRATGDIDLFVRSTTENAERVYAALTVFGAPLAAHGITISDFAQEGWVYQLGLPPRRIDVLTSISGVSFDDAWASRVPLRLAGVDVFVIGRDALIRNKRAAGRPKDVLDADLLEQHDPLKPS